MKTKFKNSIVTLLVRNNCVYDSRVIRAAETLSSAGNEVTVICVHKDGLPIKETKNKVKYIRLKTRSIKEILLSFTVVKRGLELFGFKLKNNTNQDQHNIGNRLNVFKILFVFLFFISEMISIISIKLIKFSSRFRIYRVLRTQLGRLYRLYGLIRRKYYQNIADFSFNRLVISNLKTIKPDFIHANELNTLGPATHYKKNFAPKTRIIYDSHELEAARDKITSQKQKQEVLKKEHDFLQYVDKTITVSNGLSKMLKEWHGINADVVYSAPIVSDKFELLKSSGQLRQAIGLSKNTPLAIYVGKLKIGRGHELIIEALQKVPNLHLAMMGVQPPKILEHHKKLAREYGLENRIHFIEPCHHAEVPFFIADADFGIIPTQNKGLSYEYAMPNKLFEMTFAGLPVIAGNLPNMVEYIESNKLGLIMNEKDPDSIADAMKDILDRLSEWSMSNHQHKKLLEQYDGLTQSRKMLGIYADLL